MDEGQVRHGLYEGLEIVNFSILWMELVKQHFIYYLVVSSSDFCN